MARRRPGAAYGGHMRARISLLALIATSIAVAACSVGNVGSPLPSASPSPILAVASRTSRPTGTPTTRPTATTVPMPTATPLSSLPSGLPTPLAEASGTPHVDRELEAFLPTILSGVPLVRASVAGSIFTSGSDMCIIICGDEPYRYAKELGVSIDDVTVAFAIGDRLAVGMIAYRARGAKTDRLIPARIAIGGYTGHGFSVGQPVTAAGRPATYLEGGFGNGEYLMTRHDVLFIVLGEAPANDNCHPGSCASRPPGPWTVPAYVTEALGGVP